MLQAPSSAFSYLQQSICSILYHSYVKSLKEASSNWSNEQQHLTETVTPPFLWQVLHLVSGTPYSLSSSPTPPSALFAFSFAGSLFISPGFKVCRALRAQSADLFSFHLSQWSSEGVMILPPRGYKAMSGDICTTAGGLATGIKFVEGLDAAQDSSSQQRIIHPKCQRCQGWETLGKRNIKKEMKKREIGKLKSVCWNVIQLRKTCSLLRMTSLCFTYAQAELLQTNSKHRVNKRLVSNQQFYLKLKIRQNDQFRAIFPFIILELGSFLSTVESWSSCPVKPGVINSYKLYTCCGATLAKKITQNCIL